MAPSAVREYKMLILGTEAFYKCGDWLWDLCLLSHVSQLTIIPVHRYKEDNEVSNGCHDTDAMPSYCVVYVKLHTTPWEVYNIKVINKKNIVSERLDFLMMFGGKFSFHLMQNASFKSG